MRKTDQKEVFEIYTDGGSRGNPGPAGIGVLVTDTNGKTVAEVSRFIGKATNNVAEYMAVIYGLHEAMFASATAVTVNVDSQLIARQLKGEYRVKDENMKKLHGIASDLFRAFDKIRIVEIPREKNKRADKLVNMALDEQVLF